MNIDRKILACVDTTPLADVVTDYASWAARRQIGRASCRERV